MIDPAVVAALVGRRSRVPLDDLYAAAYAIPPGVGAIGDDGSLVGDAFLGARLFA